MQKAENHAAAIALYFMDYNVARVRQTLRVTPAMEAGTNSIVPLSVSIVPVIRSPEMVSSHFANAAVRPLRGRVTKVPLFPSTVPSAGIMSVTAGPK